MVVDLLNTTVAGGAANAARRLHRSLRDHNVNSRFWHLKHSSLVRSDASFQVVRWSQQSSRAQQTASKLVAAVRKPFMKRRLRRALGPRSDDAELFTSAFQPRRTPLDPFSMGSDVFHLHWIANFVDYPSFFAAIPDSFPLVWTLHDVNPLTGGCHYTGDCEHFVTECRDCPQLVCRGARDLSQVFFQAKVAAVRNKNLHIVAPSHWMEHQARRSQILRDAKSFQTIHNGLNLDRFSPSDRNAARKQLGIPVDQPVMCFGAESIGSRRKGIRELLSALRLVRSEIAFRCVIFGNGQLPPADGGLPEIKSMGYVHDELAQALIYAAADVFVLPSLEDNLPQTGVESIACGTPVVAFRTGGIPDYVIPNETGLLAKCGDSRDLARQLVWILSHSDARERMAFGARQYAEREFDEHRQAAKYISLYESVLGMHKTEHISVAHTVEMAV